MTYIEELYIKDNCIFHYCDEMTHITVKIHNIYELRKDKVYKCIYCKKCIPKYLSHCFEFICMQPPNLYIAGLWNHYYSKEEFESFKYETIYTK